jgi:hypothetical protein
MSEQHSDGPLEQKSASNLLLCGLAWGTGLVHVQAALDHFGEYVPYALSFVALAALQLSWGTAAYRRPSRRLWAAGAAGNVAVIVIWALSRTSGLPFGPDARAPETVGLLDLIATIDEVMLVALLLWGLIPIPSFRCRQPQRWAVTSVQTIALLMILSTALVLGGGVHAH